MTLQEFIAVWQAQPFRSFRIHTPRATFSVDYPLGVALSPQMSVLVVAGNSRVEPLAPEEITRCEVVGQPVSIADAINAVAPETLARNAQLLTAAASASVPVVEFKSSPAFDPGELRFKGKRAAGGTFLVHATVNTREGQPIFDTAGTRWNLHGTEKFENGTSLYLHHLDHPTVEQRIIIWPPDTGTFESFAESMPMAALTEELKKRDRQLADKPAKETNPPPAFFKQSRPVYRKIERKGRTEIVGREEVELSFDRFEIHLVPRGTKGGVTVKCPCLIDVPAEDFLFSLVDTDWDATFERGERTFTLSLRYAGGKKVLKLILDPSRIAAHFPGSDKALLPLGFVERHLRNFALHESWDLMIAALRAGPVKAKQPDLVLPLAQGFRAEFWGGETRFPLPFLQPRFLDSKGRTLLDLRATMWGAFVRAHKTKPQVTLHLLSSEDKNRLAPSRFELQVDLVTQRVTCSGLKGSTTLGMIQNMIRHVRGMKWLSEDLPTWFAKGRLLPVPGVGQSQKGFPRNTPNTRKRG